MHHGMPQDMSSYHPSHHHSPHLTVAMLTGFHHQVASTEPAVVQSGKKQNGGRGEINQIKT